MDSELLRILIGIIAVIAIIIERKISNNKLKDNGVDKEM